MLAVNAHAVGRCIVTPEELPVRGGNAHDSFLSELHVLPLPGTIDGDGRRVSGHGTIRHLALPDGFPRFLVQRYEGRLLAAGRADDFVAVDQGRFAIAPGRRLAAKIGGEALAPDGLAVRGTQADQVAAQAQRIEQLAVDRRRAARSLFPLRPALLVDGSNAHSPRFLAVLFGKGPNDLVIAAIAHAKDQAGGDGRRAVAAAYSLGLPGEWRPFLGPCLEQTMFLGDCVAVGSLPLRPVELLRRVRRRRPGEQNQSAKPCERLHEGISLQQKGS